MGAVKDHAKATLTPQEQEMCVAARLLLEGDN